MKKAFLPDEDGLPKKKDGELKGIQPKDSYEERFYEVFRQGQWEKDLPDKKEFDQYRKEWDERSASNSFENGPLHIDLELCGRCNLKCIFCLRQKDSNINIQKNMPKSVAQSLLKEAAMIGVKSVGYNLWGESLLRDDLSEIIAYGTKAGIIDNWLHTNAVLLSPKISRSLIDAGLTRLSISIDAFSEETYKKLRGSDLKMVVKNVEDFLKLKEARGLGYPQVMVTFLLLKDNKNEWLSFKDYWASRGVNEIRIQKLVSYDDWWNTDITGVPYPEFRCPELNRRLSIRSDGSVFACCSPTEHMYVGKYPDNSLKEIWSSKKHIMLFDLHKEGRAHVIPDCMRCIRLKNCDLK